MGRRQLKSEGHEPARVGLPNRVLGRGTVGAKWRIPLICCTGVLSAVAGCADVARSWQLQHSATAGSAVEVRQRGKEFRIACRLNPADLYVSIAGLKPAPHARTLQISSGGHVVVLPLLGTVRSPLVEAAGPVPEPFLHMLNSTSPLTISYGGGTFSLGSMSGPVREALAIACGKSAGTWAPRQKAS